MVKRRSRSSVGDTREAPNDKRQQFEDAADAPDSRSRAPQSSTIFNCIGNFPLLLLQQISSGKSLKSCRLDEHKPDVLGGASEPFDQHSPRHGSVPVSSGSMRDRPKVCNANRAILWALESQARFRGREGPAISKDGSCAKKDTRFSEILRLQHNILT
jgi:hypothetical protein